MKSNSDKCPVCGVDCPVSTIGNDLWGCCETDGIKWRVNENPFAAGQHEMPTNWLENAEKLSRYQEFAKPPTE